MAERLKRWLASPRAPWLAVLLALALASVALGNGFIGDDHFLRVICRGHAPFSAPASAPFDLFDFATGRSDEFQRALELGNFPWWTAPDLKLSFMRPLASLSHSIDFAAFPDNPALMHLVSLLWFAASVLVVGSLHRRFEPVPWAAGLATVIFAIDDGHAIPLGWIANRNALLATFFAAGALLAHDRWRRDGVKLGAVLSPLALAAALLSGELGLSVVGFYVAHALSFEAGLRRRLIALAPAAGVVAAWRAGYLVLGHGARGSGLYLDPQADPLSFLRAALERTPILAFGALGGQGTDLWPALSPRADVVFGVLAAAASVAIVLGLRQLLARDSTARFWAIGTGLALLPGAATFPNDRLLLIASIGSAGLVARTLASQRIERGVPRALAAFFVLAHIGVPLVLLPLRTRSIRRMAEVGLAVQSSLPADIAGRTLVLVNVPDSLFCLQMHSMNASTGYPLPRHVRCLSATANPIEVSRPSERRIVLASDDGFLESAMGTLGRARSIPFHVGDRVTTSVTSATVTALTPDGRPREVAFDFDRPLSSDELRFVSWQGQRFVPFVPPPAGETRTIPPAPMWRILLGD